MFLFQQSSSLSKTLLSLNRSLRVLLFCDLRSTVNSLQKIAGNVIIYYKDHKYHSGTVSSPESCSHYYCSLWAYNYQHYHTTYFEGPQVNYTLLNNQLLGRTITIINFVWSQIPGQWNYTTLALKYSLNTFFFAPRNHFLWELCWSNCARKGQEGA